MKKLFTLFTVAMLFVSTSLVGCGGGVDNKAVKTDTTGKKAPKMEQDDSQDDEKGKRKTTAAGGEAKTETPPD